MKEEYKEKIREFKELLKNSDEMEEDTDEMEDDLLDLQNYLVRENSFENSLDRRTAERIIERQQQESLEIHGGYPLWSEVSFKINEEEYTVIAYGASEENEGEDAIFGIIFVKEDDESKKMRKWGRFQTERDFIRFNKYLDEVKNGIREPTGKDEFGDVPYICEKCKRNEATVYSSKGKLCGKCDKES